LSEAECYARCYGAGDDAVRVLWDGPEAAPVRRLSREDVRLLFVPADRTVRRDVVPAATLRASASAVA